jgi:hypothetical protein
MGVFLFKDYAVGSAGVATTGVSASGVTGGVVVSSDIFYFIR